MVTSETDMLSLLICVALSLGSVKMCVHGGALVLALKAKGNVQNAVSASCRCVQYVLPDQHAGNPPPSCNSVAAQV